MTELLLVLIQQAEPVVVQQAVNWVTVTLALIAIVPTTVGAIISGMVLLQSKRNAEVAATTDAKVDEVKVGNNANGEKLTEIHTFTNSNLSKVQTQLEVSNKTIESLNHAQVESAKRIASMEQMIASLIPTKGHSTSDTNSEKLDNLKAQLTSVQSGSPPIPVKDDAVLAKLNDVVIGKLDDIQTTVDNPSDNKTKQ